jgi:hypothetical protein
MAAAAAAAAAAAGCLAVWLSGCLAVWLSGCLGNWATGLGVSETESVSHAYPPHTRHCYCWLHTAPSDDDGLNLMPPLSCSNPRSQS